MKETMNKLIEEMKEFKRFIIKKAVDEGALDELNGDLLDLMQRTDKLLESSIDLSVQYVECIEEQNKKLDILLERTKHLEES